MLKLLASIFAILVIAGLFAFSPIFKIKTVELSSGDCVRDDNLAKYYLSEKNLILLNTSKLEAELKSEYSCAKALRLTKEFPSKLKIEIESQKPLLKIENSNLVLGDDGTISESTNQTLPTIVLPQEVNVVPGQKVEDARTLFAVQVAGLVLKTDFNTRNIRISDGDVAIYDAGGLIVLFTPTKPAQAQVDSLQSILGKAKIDAAKIAKIDLRFDKPVVVNK